MESHTNQVNIDINQAFAQYVDTQVGHHKRDELFSHPGDTQALHILEDLSDAFIAGKRENLIEQFKPTVDLKAMYQHQKNHLIKKKNQSITNAGGAAIYTSKETMSSHAIDDIASKKDKATNGVIPGHRVDNTLEYLHIKKKETEK